MSESKSKSKKTQRPYIDINLPREWKRYLSELLTDPEIKKQLEISGFTMTHSGVGSWIIREFLVDHTSFHFEHFNTYEDHATIIDNKIRRMIDLYPKNGKLWCEYCENTDCEHVKFALTVPEIVNPLKKKGWKPA